ncbi:unnamed protein product [Albugo candida]|uniref:Uncharacterized protein n=1 Tax=Albugo candida TaxID=65357 RepID=A0A024FV08_9STRA|nr:unnamed protein product [Albugo candida]|eukprot:CCI10960.1 unnamed protein product [Albugo candida]
MRSNTSGRPNLPFGIAYCLSITTSPLDCPSAQFYTFNHALSICCLALTITSEKDQWNLRLPALRLRKQHHTKKRLIPGLLKCGGDGIITQLSVNGSIGTVYRLRIWKCIGSHVSDCKMKNDAIVIAHFHEKTTSVALAVNGMMLSIIQKSRDEDLNLRAFISA